MLNIYLDHVLDQPWRTQHPDVPLLRYADDLLLLCRDSQEAEHCLTDLRSQLQPAGMMLKTPSRKGHIRDLAAGRDIDWLGFRVKKNRGDLSIRPGRAAFTQLAMRLARAHEAPVPSLTGAAVIRGWFDQMGPTRKRAHRSRAYANVAAVAAKAGFDEIPREERAMTLWSAAYAQWCCLTESVASTTQRAERV